MCAHILGSADSPLSLQAVAAVHLVRNIPLLYLLRGVHAGLRDERNFFHEVSVAITIRASM